MTLLGLGLLALMGALALFNAADAALSRTTRAQLRLVHDRGGAASADALALHADPDRTRAALALGRWCAGLGLGGLIVPTLAQMIGPLTGPIAGGVGTAVSVIVTALLIYAVADLLPRQIAALRPDAILLALARIIRGWVRLAAPLCRLLERVAANAAGANNAEAYGQHGQSSMATDAIRGVVERHHEAGSMERGARDLVRGALSFEATTVEQIMVHRSQLEMIDINLEPRQIVEAVLRSRHSRIPFYDGETDDIVGVLHVKDLLRGIWAHGAEFARVDLRVLMKPPYFVPETTTLQEQLDAFKQKKRHFALIVDEYGALRGLVTLEDVIEEIVGEIEDEYDAPMQGVERRRDGSVIVDGTVPVRDLNRLMDWTLPEEDAVTVAGLVIHAARAIPDAGQMFAFYGYRFDILKKQRNQVTALRILRAEG